MNRLVAILSLVLIAGCSSGEELAVCKGSVFQLNTGHWDPQPADLVKPATVNNE